VSEALTTETTNLVFALGRPSCGGIRGGRGNFGLRRVLRFRRKEGRVLSRVRTGSGFGKGALFLRFPLLLCLVSKRTQVT